MNLYIQVFGCRADDTKTKQLSMTLNHLPLIGVKHWQEPAGWDRGRGPCTMLSRCHKRPGPPRSPAHGEALALTELCVSGEALPGGKPE